MLTDAQIVSTYKLSDLAVIGGGPGKAILSWVIQACGWQTSKRLKWSNISLMVSYIYIHIHTHISSYRLRSRSQQALA